MPNPQTDAKNGRLRLRGTDIEVRARVDGARLTVDVLKSGVCVHRLLIDDATAPLEHAWITDLFAGENRVELRELAGQVDDYVTSLDTNQG